MNKGREVETIERDGLMEELEVVTSFATLRDMGVPEDAEAQFQSELRGELEQRLEHYVAGFTVSLGRFDSIELYGPGGNQIEPPESLVQDVVEAQSQAIKDIDT